DRASDPWVSFATNGDVYVSALVLNDPELEFPHGVYVSKSTDGGFSWGAPAKVIVNTDPFFVVNDKPAITADPTNPTYAYLTWDRYDIIPNLQPTYFARTTDGGQTWSTPVAIYDPGFNLGTLSNQIVVMPNGTLVDMFAEFNFSTGDVS